MTISQTSLPIRVGRRAVDERGNLTTEYWSLLNNLLQAINSNATQANTDIASASSAGDLKTFGISASFAWWSDSAGVAPAGNPTRDLVVVFNEDGSQVATHTIRGTLTSAAGTISAASQASTGEATTVSVINNASDSVRVDVTHTASGAIASASFSYVDQSTAGGAPASGGGK